MHRGTRDQHGGTLTVFDATLKFALTQWAPASTGRPHGTSNLGGDA